jgi:hypothetical protein
MKRQTPAKSAQFSRNLGLEQLTGLRAEMQSLRQYPPITRRADGKYEGDILGFVKGLRFSARVAYFLRERLSTTGLEVNWGHLVDSEEQSCSAECDVIVHTAGHIRKWNGTEKPIMNFVFVDAKQARVVVSCKSVLNSIDKDHPNALKKYGVQYVYLFAETCDAKRMPALRKAALKAGYAGVWCLYTTGSDTASFTTDEPALHTFGDTVLKVAIKTANKAVKKAAKKLVKKATGNSVKKAAKKPAKGVTKKMATKAISKTLKKAS